MIRQPVDSYHRLIREAHGFEGRPDPGPSSRSGSRRFTSAPPPSAGGSGSQYGNVASFFDSERLASSSAQHETDTFASPGSRTVRWPFLGSIRSRASRSLSPSPLAESPVGGSEIELPWRHPFLRRRVLIACAVVFAGLIAGLQAVLQVSQRNDGIRQFNDVARYLWQYGTTLLFTVVAALWTRVEFQASAAMPWIRLLNNQVEADKSLLLDYISMFEPRAIFRAIRNRDWLVACPVTTGLLLKVIIIFSTAFITPRVVTVSSHRSTISLQAGFSNDVSGLQGVGSLPFFTMAFIEADNITFPNGVSPRAAYQPFTVDRGDFLTLRAPVDGFIGSLNCTEAELTLDSLRLVGGGDAVRLNVTVSGTDCDTNQTFTSTRFTTTKNESLPRTFLAFQAGTCGGSTELDQQRIVVYAGILDLDVNDLRRQSSSRINGTISTSTAFICSPNYAITTLQVSKGPDNIISATPVRGATNTTLDQVQPWDIAQALFDTFDADEATERAFFTSSNRQYDSEAVVDADKAMSAALALKAAEEREFPALELLTDGDTVRQLSQDYFAQYSALVARYGLMEPTSTSAPATTSFVERRLIVRPVPAYLMTGLLAICLVLTLVMIFFAPKRGYLPRDPSTLIGMVSVVAHSHPLVECLRGMGPATKEAIRSRLKDSAYSSGAEGHEKLGDSNLGYFHIFGGKAPPRNVQPRRFDSSVWRQPVPMHGLIRFLYIAILASVIIGFEVSLRASQRFNGLRTIANDSAYLAWTVVPALALLLVALYMTTLEWWTRVLSPYAHLSRQGEFDETVGLNLADAFRPVAWWRAWKIKDVAAVTAISGGFIALLMVVASAPLFEPMPVGRNTSIPLRTDDFFANNLASSPDDPICTDCTNDTLLASLILAGNAPFPAFTFADLNLPGMSIVEGQDLMDDDVTITATLTAIRSNMTCRLYLSDEISTNLTLEYTLDDDIVNPLRIDLEGETCRGRSERNGSNAIISTAISEFSQQADLLNGSSIFFGAGLGKTSTSPQCSDFLYVWGRLDDLNSDDMGVGGISGLACNETIEAVDVDVVFHGPDLRIYPGQPPAVREETVRNTTVAIPLLDYSSLVNISTAGLLDAFFATLNASSFAVPDDILGDPTTDSASQVQSAILQQHGVIRTQSLNLKSRRRLSSRGTFPTAGGQNIVSGVDPDLTVSQAVPILSGEQVSERIRLRQDPLATRILQGLVGGLLLLHIISWIFTTRLRMPRPPTTIASITALLVDGNLLKILPRGAQWQPEKELRTNFGEGLDAKYFEMAWAGARQRRTRTTRTTRRDPRKRKEEGAYGIRVLDAEVHMPVPDDEDLEMRPIPPRKNGLTPAERVGTVRRGTATVGTESTQRKSVMIGKENSPGSGSKKEKNTYEPPPKRKRSFTAWSGPKEMAKVWWTSGK
ncbi:hypothetical protein ACJ41O_000856 [Fusarium nematophilum]